MQKGGWLIIGVVVVAALAMTILLSSCKSRSGGASVSDGSAVLTFDSFDGGGPEYTVTIDDPTVLTCKSERTYHKKNHEELDGASYTITYTFRGTKAGTTTVTVSARSPIADNFDATYSAVVDDNLIVTLTETGRTDDDENPIDPVPTLVMVVNDVTFYPTIADTSAADSFIRKLSSEPLELTLQDYSDYEKTGELPWYLPREDVSMTAKPGDILLYNGNQLCLFYDENKWDFTPLASINDMTQEKLLDVLGDGDVTVQMWVEWSE